MSELVRRFPDQTSLKERFLQHAVREVLLAMASDWPFIISNGTSVVYAERRMKEHIYNFNLVYENMCRNSVDTEWLTRTEKRTNIFPDIDYRVFSGDF
jgi:1,4-alpha-glucan branching enzyme